MSRYIPYQPMATPKQVSVERMQQILDKRTKINGGRGEPETVTAGATAAAPPPSAKLQWEKPASKDATGVYTTCKRYSCSKVTTNGKTTYELWKVVPGGGWFRPLISGLASFIEAQTAAQKDLEASHVRA